MPGYHITACEAKEFAAYQFFASKGPKRTVEGKFTFITYTADTPKDDQTGAAVGLINRARELNGIQIGLLNYCGEIPHPIDEAESTADGRWR